ncbi:hypothetical protein VULLAG_LOCUS8469 [Vulpes lagopus]
MCVCAALEHRPRGADWPGARGGGSPWLISCHSARSTSAPGPRRGAARGRTNSPRGGAARPSTALLAPPGAAGAPEAPGGGGGAVSAAARPPAPLLAAR